MPKKKEPSLPTFEAIVLRENQRWYALYRRNMFEQRKAPLSDEDAWNFDIDRGLRITVAVDEYVDPPKCKILKRKGNKRFVKVDKVQ